MGYDLVTMLKESFDGHFQAPVEAWAEYASYCEIIEAENETILKRKNRPETNFYFIISGCVGLFLPTRSNDVCLDFAFERNFCADYMSVVTHQATPLEMRCIERSVMAGMPVKKFRELGNTPIGMQLMRVSAEASFVDKQQQQIDLLTKSAAVRLAELELRLPGISNRVAQKYIASYLGITPQSLSRIRKSEYRSKLPFGKSV